MDTILDPILVVSALALWGTLAVIVAGTFGRIAASGEHHYQMDALYRSVAVND